MHWNLSDAKNRLSEVLRLADSDPQTITRRDKDYVVISGDEYRKLKGEKMSFIEFLVHAGPKFDEPLEIPDRKASPMREVEF